MTGPHDPADRPEDGPEISAEEAQRIIDATPVPPGDLTGDVLEISAEQAQRIIDADRPGGVPGDGPGV